MIATELMKQLRRVRTWVAFAGLMALPIIATIAQKLDHSEQQDPRGGAIFAFSKSSGFNNAFAALAFMSSFFLVIVVCSFAGESVAGEASWGTLRYLLLRPVGRLRLLGRKAIVIVLMTLIATLIISLTGLIAGTIAFGWHPLRLPPFVDLTQSRALVRLGLATGFVVVNMLSIAAFALFLSVMTDSAGGAIGGAVAFAIASQILSGISALKWIRYGLPTHYWDSWQPWVFLRHYPAADMARSLVVTLAYVAVFGALTMWRFRTKDILS
jgi:ABC-2 type transport system permease protein